MPRVRILRVDLTQLVPPAPPTIGEIVTTRHGAYWTVQDVRTVADGIADLDLEPMDAHDVPWGAPVRELPLRLGEVTRRNAAEPT